MCRCSTVMKTLILLTVSLHLSSAVTHTLQFVITGVTSGINLPEFTSVAHVDGDVFSYYDSNLTESTPKTEWIKKINDDYPDYWGTQALLYKDWQGTFKTLLNMGQMNLNHTTELHTLQLMVGCELDDDKTTRRYIQLGYDGEDFLSFDLNARTWIPARPEAVVIKQILDFIGGFTTEEAKDFMQTTCIEWLSKYVSYGRETLERKVPPEVSVFQKHSSPSPEVVCHATGFFPKAVMITWQKDGEDVHEDVDLRETLPNQDGSFQKRSILKVPAEELQKHTYTCVVQHSSLEKEIREGLPGGAPIAIIVGVIIALLVLAAVVAGVVIYKKKNSGFRSVPPRPSSEGDSSSNNS